MPVSALQQVESLYQKVPKQQVDLQLQEFAAAIKRQQRSMKYSKTAQLHFTDPLEAQIAGEFFSSLFPDPKRARLGIMELMINAIEHGNLGITQEEKHRMMADGSLVLEMATGLASPLYSDKYVHTYVSEEHDSVQIIIQDDGSGFDWRPYIKRGSLDSLDSLQRLNGRGIAMAKFIAFDELVYNDAGNMVKAVQYI